MHRIIGGDMYKYHSSNDPIFFNHHANIDKLWGDWQKQSEDHRKAFTSNYGCCLRSHPMPGSTATPEDMLDLRSQKYYDPFEYSKYPIDVSVEYVDLDTKDEWGKGNTLSLDLGKLDSIEK